MADVFISYDENSAESVVRQISATLERDGISCWYVGRDMEKDALRGVITKAIRDCRVFLLALNENALKSAYVQTEIALALQGFGDNRQRGLLAVRVDNSGAEAQLDAFLERLRARDDFPSDMKPFHIADGSPLNPDGLRKLKTRIQRFLNPSKPSRDSMNLPEKRRVRTRAWGKSAKQKKTLKVAVLVGQKAPVLKRPN